LGDGIGSVKVLGLLGGRSEAGAVHRKDRKDDEQPDQEKHEYRRDGQANGGIARYRAGCRAWLGRLGGL
jgi:hypothetical protein